MLHKDKQPFCITCFCYACGNEECKEQINWLYKHEDKVASKSGNLSKGEKNE